MEIVKQKMIAKQPTNSSTYDKWEMAAQLSEAWEQDLLSGMSHADSSACREHLLAVNEKTRRRLESDHQIRSVTASLGPSKRACALRFLCHEGALDLIGEGRYPRDSVIPKIAAHLQDFTGADLNGLINKLGFYLTKHGSLNACGFLEHFDFAKLLQAFNTRVCHMLILDDQIQFNMPLFVNLDQVSSHFRTLFPGRIQKCWLVSYIVNHGRATPSLPMLKISSLLSRFTDLNHQALYYLNTHDKSIAACLRCLDALEDMLSCYLDLLDWVEVQANDSGKRTREKIEVEVFTRIRRSLTDSLKEELNVSEIKQIPLKTVIPARTEALLMAFDAYRCERLIETDLQFIPSSELSKITAAELINIVHQKGLALSPKLFGQLRQAGGRVVSEICHEGTRFTPRRTNDFVTYIDLRQTHQDDSIPFPVRVIAHALARNANIIPESSRLKVIVYADDLDMHLDVRIGAHSAHIHCNLAPPEFGGRFALYYAEGGADEGNLRRLEVMGRTLRKIGLKVNLTGQFIEALYDKDTGATTADAVCRKLSSVLQMISSMPDLDHILGGFNATFKDSDNVESYGYFNKASMDQLLEAWAQHCSENGFFFLNLLRPTRAEIDRFYPRSQLYWQGCGGYTDPYLERMRVYGPFLERILTESMERVGAIFDSSCCRDETSFGQSFLDCLIDREEWNICHSFLAFDGKGSTMSNSLVVESQIDPLDVFADRLQTDQSLQRLAEIAQLANRLSAYGSWIQLGKLGGLDVNRLRLVTKEDVVSFFCLSVPGSRESLLAFAVLGETPHRLPCLNCVAGEVLPSNLVECLQDLERIARNFGPSTGSAKQRLPAVTWETVKDYLERENPPDLDLGATCIPGIVSCPGVVTGRLRFNSPDRPVQDFYDAILIDRFLSPADDPKIHAARGILTTSGGELSHAAIRAREFRKPSLILKDVQYQASHLAYLPHFNPATASQVSVVVRDLSIPCSTCLLEAQEPVVVSEEDLVRLDAERGLLFVIGGRGDIQTGFQLIMELQDDPDLQRSLEELCSMLAASWDFTVYFFLLSEWTLIQDPSLDRLEKILSAAKSNPKFGPDFHDIAQSLVVDLIGRTESFLQNLRTKILRSGTLTELFYLLGLAAAKCDKLQNILDLFNVVPSEDTCPKEKLAGLCQMVCEKIEQSRPAVLESVSHELSSLERDSKPLPSKFNRWRSILAEAKDAQLEWESEYRELSTVFAALERSKMEQLEELLRCLPESRYLIPKTELDRDYRRVVGGKAAHSGEIIMALRGLEDKAICSPQGFALSTCVWKLLERGEDVVVDILDNEFTAALRPFLLSQTEFFKGALEERSISRIADSAQWVQFRSILRQKENVESLMLQKELALFAKWLMSLAEVQTDSVISTFCRYFARFAVRSSGIKEDSLEESFAGQKLTILNVLGPINLRRAVLHVYASGCEAILVEEMIPAEVSGVAFSVQPSTANFDRIVVNCAYGLGEGIVSGHVDPDRIILDKRTGHAMTQPTIGNKLTRVVPSGEDIHSTTKEEAVAEAFQKRLSLKEKQQLQLVLAVNTLEKHFGTPIDVEWAVDPLGWFFVLQCRPITTLWRTIEEGRERYRGWLQEVASAQRAE